MKGKFRLDDVVSRMDAVNSQLPRMLSKQAENYFVLSFKQQGFNHKGWQEVKRRIAGTPEYKYPKKKGLSRRTKPILVGTGKLRRAVSNSTRTLTPKEIKLVVDLPYAANHNEGDTVPKRQFMGQTPELTMQQKKLIESQVDKIWQV
jgi:phage gpG-like protein